MERDVYKKITIITTCICILAVILAIRPFMQWATYGDTLYIGVFWTRIMIAVLAAFVEAGTYKLRIACEDRISYLTARLIEMEKKAIKQQKQIDSLHKKINDIRNDLRKEPHP